MNFSNQTNEVVTTTTRATTPAPDPYIAAFILFARRFQDFCWNSLWPSIGSIGCLLNIICCVIFTRPQFKSKMYRLLFYGSLYKACALFVIAFYPTMRAIRGTFSTMVYQAYFRSIVVNTFLMSSVLCDVAVSFDRYILVSQKFKTVLSKIPALALALVFFVVSFGLFCFPLYGLVIDIWYYERNNSTLHYFFVDYNQFGLSPNYNRIRIASFAVKDMVLWILFVTTNALLVYETKKHMNKKKRLTKKNNAIKIEMMSVDVSNNVTSHTQVSSVQAVTESAPSKDAASAKSKSKKSNSEKAEFRITMMVIITSSILVLGGLASFIRQIYFNFIWGTYFQVFLNNFADLMLFLSISVVFFVYYFFDKNFKSNIRSLFSIKNKFGK